MTSVLTNVDPSGTAVCLVFSWCPLRFAFPVSCKRSRRTFLWPSTWRYDGSRGPVISTDQSKAEPRVVAARYLPPPNAWNIVNLRLAIIAKSGRALLDFLPSCSNDRYPYSNLHQPRTPNSPLPCLWCRLRGDHYAASQKLVPGFTSTRNRNSRSAQPSNLCYSRTLFVGKASANFLYVSLIIGVLSYLCLTVLRKVSDSCTRFRTTLNTPQYNPGSGGIVNKTSSSTTFDLQLPYQIDSTLFGDTQSHLVDVP